MTDRKDQKTDEGDKLFGDEFADLEKELEDQNLDKKGANPFGQSITKELLQQSKKEIADELSDIDMKGAAKTKDLKIEIDEDADYEKQNNLAQENLNNKLIENEMKQSQPLATEEEELEIELSQDQILAEFNEIYKNDQALRDLLGEFPDRYSFDEKASIIQAYRKGGGVEGLKEIIDDDDEEEEQPGQPAAQAEMEAEDDDEEEMDIDLDNPEHMKIISDEFENIYKSDEQFRTNFGEEAFQLAPYQKYQIIDAYNKNGMAAVMDLLQNSADQSGIMQQMEGQGEMMGEEGEESVVIHQGKKYNRI